MRTCPWVERVERFFDGETASETGAKVAAHLSGCPECAAHLAQLRRLRRTVGRSVLKEEIRDAQFDAFMAGVREQIEAPHRRWGRFLALASLTAAALVAAFSTFLIINDGPKKVDATVVESCTTELQGATVKAYDDDKGVTTIVITASKDDIW